MRKESKGAVPIKFARTEQTTKRERTPLTFLRLSLKFNVRMRKAHTAHAWSQKGALRPGNIKSHSCCCVAFNAEKRASRYSALHRKSIEPLPASILDSDSHAILSNLDTNSDDEERPGERNLQKR